MKLLSSSALWLLLGFQMTASIRLSAQGTTHISNLEANSLGYVAIASNAKLAQSFDTGANSLGYFLNSVQLSLAVPTGSPSGFTVSLFEDKDFHPGASMGTLTGSTNPSVAGIFSYEADNTTLSPSSKYWIVLSAQTPLTIGAYYSGLASFFDYTSTGTWSTDRFYNKSTDGLVWTDSIVGYNLKFSVAATAIPEPSITVLLGLSGLLPAIWLGRKVRSL